ncbi:MAG: glycoside hydrolase family 43 protein, partial [Prevotellaceae bacterium]|nr:glycoside hydrolase family 43 protein [Prevotellaceae bacterium]
ATALVAVPRVILRIDSDGNGYTFSYSKDGKSYQSLGTLNCSLLSTEVAGGFTGVIIGMYATGKTQATFSDFQFEGK